MNMMTWGYLAFVDLTCLLLFRILQSCDMTECCDTAVTEIEEGLAEVTTVPEVVSGDWIEECLDDVALRINHSTSEHHNLELNETKTKVNNGLVLCSVISRLSTYLVFSYQGNIG